MEYTSWDEATKPLTLAELDLLSELGNSVVFADVQSNGRGYVSLENITPLSSCNDISQYLEQPTNILPPSLLSKSHKGDLASCSTVTPKPAIQPAAPSIVLPPPQRVIHVHTARCTAGCLSGTACTVPLCRGAVKSMKCMTGLCVKHCKLSGRCHLKDHKSANLAPAATQPRNPPSIPQHKLASAPTSASALTSASAPTPASVPPSSAQAAPSSASAAPASIARVPPSTQARSISQTTSPALAALLERQLADQKRVAQEKADHTRMTDQRTRSVNMCFWMQDGPRSLVQVQDISTFPSFNIATSVTSLDRYLPTHPDGSSALLHHLRLARADFVDVWSAEFEDWVSKPVDHVMQVSSGQTILVRRSGVQQCDKLDVSLELSRPPPTHTTTSRHVSKRQYQDSLHRAEERRSKTPRLDEYMTATSAGPPAPSPPSCSVSASSAPLQSYSSDLSLTTSMLSSASLTLSSSAISPSASEMEAGAQAAAAAIVRDRQARNEQKRVYVGLADNVWPNGILVRDMVDAFEFDRQLKKEPGYQLLPDRLRHIFSGTRVQERSYQMQKAAWSHMTPLERGDARKGASEREWTEWRKNKNGWLYVSKKMK